MARIRVLATTHGRNADWAEKAVREAANISASEALELGVIENRDGHAQLLHRPREKKVEPKAYVVVPGDDRDAHVAVAPADPRCAD